MAESGTRSGNRFFFHSNPLPRLMRAPPPPPSLMWGDVSEFLASLSRLGPSLAMAAAAAETPLLLLSPHSPSLMEAIHLVFSFGGGGRRNRAGVAKAAQEATADGWRRYVLKCKSFLFLSLLPTLLGCFAVLSARRPQFRDILLPPRPPGFAMHKAEKKFMNGKKRLHRDQW